MLSTWVIGNMAGDTIPERKNSASTATHTAPNWPNAASRRFVPCGAGARDGITSFRVMASAVFVDRPLPPYPARCLRPQRPGRRAAVAAVQPGVQRRADVAHGLPQMRSHGACRAATIASLHAFEDQLVSRDGQRPGVNAQLV